MSRVIKKCKGFAMAELLAICVVILVIFAILFANYLPLLAEYEVRISYNNVTSQYAAHYIRTVYKDAIEKNPDLVSAGVEGSFFTVYDPDASPKNEQIYNHITDQEEKEKLRKVIEEYGIEEIVISKYITTDLKNNYPNNGAMKKYVNYLPQYKNSIYTGENLEQAEQLYRITLKTKDFGYATTPIFSDHLTPDKCFKLQQENDYFVVTGYNFDDEECSTDVAIEDRFYSDGSKKAKIKKIGEGAFESTPITSISIPKEVIEIGDDAFRGSVSLTKFTIDADEIKIGDYAFYGTGIEKFNYDNDSKISNVTSIGDYAFANTKISTINLKNGVEYGDYVFSGNKKLATLNLNDTDSSSGTFEASVGMFQNCGTDTENGFAVTFTSNLGNISEKMFAVSKIASINFDGLNSGVTDIGVSAFDQILESEGLTGKTTNLIDIDISKTNINKISENAFHLLPINSIELKNGKLSIIGDGSFRGYKSSSFNDSDRQNYKNHTKELVIPNTVEKIGNYAFAFGRLEKLTFGYDSEVARTKDNPIIISSYAFAGNNIVGSNTKEGLIMPEYMLWQSGATYSFAYNDFVSITWPKEFYHFYIDSDGDVVIDETSSQIPGRSFAGSNLSDGVIIPNYVNKINSHAFYKTNLSSLDFECGSTSKLVIQNYAFAESSLKSMTLPSRVSAIGNYAFLNTGISSFDYSDKTTYNPGNAWCNIFHYNDTSIYVSGTFSCSVNNDTEIVMSAEQKVTGGSIPVNSTITINKVSGEGCVE